MSQCGVKFLELLIALYIILVVSHTKADLNVNCMQTPIREIKRCCNFPKFQYKVFEKKCGKPKSDAGTLTPYFVACNIACVFDELDIVDDNNDLNLVHIESVMRQLTTDNDFVEVYTNAFSTCNARIKNKLSSKMKTSNKRKNQQQHCSPKPLMYVLCAQNEAFVHCPPSAWVNSVQCNKTRKYVQECVQF